MKHFDVIWIEDDEDFVRITLENFKLDGDDLGFRIMPFHYRDITSFKGESGDELKGLYVELVCVDYNLPGGVNGNEIITQIRAHKHNRIIPIIFYSAAKNEQELKDILSESLKDLEGIYFAQKDTLEDQIVTLLGE